MDEGRRPSGEVIEGVLERIVFRSEDSGYGVARFKVKGQGDPVTITGLPTKRSGTRWGKTSVVSMFFVSIVMSVSAGWRTRS